MRLVIDIKQLSKFFKELFKDYRLVAAVDSSCRKIGGPLTNDGW